MGKRIRSADTAPTPPMQEKARKRQRRLWPWFAGLSAVSVAGTVSMLVPLLVSAVLVVVAITVYLIERRR